MHRLALAAAPLAFSLIASPAFAQPPAWTGEGSLSAATTTGNTETTDLGLGLKLKHTGAVWTQSGELTGEYAETNGIERKNRIRGAAQIDRAFAPRLSGFARGTYERDEFSGFEQRYFLGAGVAWQAIESPGRGLRLQAAPGYKVEEVRATGEKNETLSLSLKSEFRQQVNERVDLTNDTEVITSTTTTQILNTLALSVELFGDLQARVSYGVRHDTDPPPGFESTDTATRFSLVYKIG